jgi:hypothetical protein
MGYTGAVGAMGYTGAVGAMGYTGAVGAMGYTGAAGYTGSMGYTGSTGPVGIFPSVILTDISFNANVSIGSNLSVLGVSFTKSISEASNSVSVGVSGGNQIYLDYKQNSIYYVNGSITSNLTCYLANVPAPNDRTYTISMIIPYASGATKYFANTLQLNTTTDTAGVYKSTNLYANGGITAVTPNASSAFITQTISVCKSSTLSGYANGGNVAFTSINSMF